MFDLNVTDEYTKKAGLEHSDKLYDCDSNNVQYDQVMKDFGIFNIVAS